jgi:hypothetical protein
MNTFKFTLALSALSSTALAGVAGVNQYDDRALFNTDAGALNLEDFESEDLGGLMLPAGFDSGLNAGLASGAVTASIEAGNPDSFGFVNTTDGGRKYLRFGQNNQIPGAPDMPETGSYSAAFSFAGLNRAFGFDLSGFQPDQAANGFNVTTLNNGQVMADFFVPSNNLFDQAGFFGFIFDDTFNEIRINIPVLFDQSADFVAFDDIAWGAVPSPSALSFLGLAGIAASRRRR